MRKAAGMAVFGLIGISMALASMRTDAQLNIIPTFDISITSRMDAAAIEAAINSDIAFYTAYYSNPITVAIKFSDMNTGLGQSSTLVTEISYADYYAALIAHATTANDALALAHIAPDMNGNNPVNGSSQIRLTTANLRALGFNVNPNPGDFDSSIGLNLSIINIDRMTIDPAKYDLQQVAYHEINEALGLGSALNGLMNGDPTPTGAIGSLDLYRYDLMGARTFTTDALSDAFFSIDGTNILEQFNNTQGGDFHDWGGNASPFPPAVQDAASTPGLTLNNGPAELTALDVVGYTPITITAATPEFGSVFSLGGLLVAGATGLWLRSRRTRQPRA